MTATNKPLLEIQIEYQSSEQLKPNPKNARVHSQSQKKKLAAGMSKFGFLNPIIVDEKNNVLAGHARLQAAKAAGFRSVPTVRVKHLSEANKIAFAIADNRLAEISSWDEKLLAEQFQILSMTDLSLEFTGFEMGEIDLMLNPPKQDTTATDSADELPPPIQGEVVSKIGDVWRLGNHRLACGSALDDCFYKSLMKESVAALGFSDPPYNVAIGGNVSGLGGSQHREFVMASGEMSPAEFVRFLQTYLGLCRRYCRQGALIDVCMDWRHIADLLAAAGAEGLELLNIAVWVKNNAGMGSLYRSQHEEVCIFKSGKAPHLNNVQLGRYGRNRPNVWNYLGSLTFSRTSDEGNLLAMHPTVKPVRLVADAILDCTRRNEIVLDPFLGSGTTIIAAERTGRRCYGIELDPIYVDTAIERWQQYCGGKAQLISTGESFDDVKNQGKSHAP